MGDLSLEKFPILDEDPRLWMDEEALDKASANGFPIVANTIRGRDRGGLLAGGAIALVLGAMTFFSLSGDNEVKEPVPAIANPVEIAQPLKPVVEMPAEVQTPPLAAPLIPPMTPAQQAILSKPPQDIAAMRPAASPVMVYDVSVAEPVATVSSTTPAAKVETKVASGTAGLNENEVFGSRMGMGDVEAASATRMVDPANTVTQGTLIPAILETAINTDMPGYVRAVVSADVRSFDGSRILVPRSSRLIGQYKSGLSAGQTRAYVMWTRLIRPDGVSVALASPAVEYSGASGITGEVDSHFFKRFGAAGLLSVIGGLGAIASGGASLVISSASTSAASVAAQNDGKIPPTITIAQGQPVRVFTARDLDFATVAQALEVQ